MTNEELSERLRTIQTKLDAAVSVMQNALYEARKVCAIALDELKRKPDFFDKLEIEAEAEKAEKEYDELMKG